MAQNRPDLSTAFANVARLLDLASWMAIGNMRRVEASDHGPGYHLKEDEGEQLAALLVVTRDYAERELKGAD